MPNVVKVEPTMTGWRLRLDCGHEELVEPTRAGTQPPLLQKELKNTKPTWRCSTCGRNRR